MTEAAAIIAQFRRAIALLAELDDPAATRIAAALDRWLAGEDLESAAGLAPGWRRSLQLAARDAALSALVARHPGKDAQALARQIVAGVRRAARVRGVRPDGEPGLYRDLFRAADAELSERHWRRLIRGQRAACNGHDQASSLFKGD